METTVVAYDPLVYWENRAPYWLAEEHESPEWEAALQEYIDPRWNVLELGCGDGRWADFFPNYTGTDISPELLAEAKRRHPGKRFAHHDMRQDVTGQWDLIFTFTAWLHMPPKDIRSVRLSDANLLFVEPNGQPNMPHCFKHRYDRLFGCKAIKRIGALTLYGRLK